MFEITSPGKVLVNATKGERVGEENSESKGVQVCVMLLFTK